MQSKIKVGEMEIVPVDFNRDKGGRKYKGKERVKGELSLSVWAEGLQSLAGVLPPTAAVASALYLKVVS